MTAQRTDTRRRRRARAWVGLAVAAVTLTIGLATAIGTTLPVRHEVARTVRLPADQASVWDRVTQPAGYAAWRSDVDSVEMLPPDAGRLRWRERRGRDATTFVVESAAMPVEVVLRIGDLDGPFGGTWTIRLAPDGSGTRVTVIERGEVYNPLVRFVSRFLIGHAASADRWLVDLGRSFGAAVTPEPGDR